MSDKKKALFLDLDGTLLDDEKSVPQGNRDAIDKMLSLGHSVVIATGRPLISAVAQAEKLGLTSPGCYLIAYNGGILYDTAARKVIFRSTLPLASVYKAFREAKSRGIHIQTYHDEKVLVEPESDDDMVRSYCRKVGMEFEVIDDIGQLDEEPVKMLIIGPDPEPLEEFRTWLASWAGDSIDTFFSNDEYCEIVGKGLNKGNALRQMAKLVEVSIEDTIAAGDAANDISMVDAAGTGCAMANGTDEIKSAADYVTEKTNNECGVAEIIERFVLT